MADTEENPFDKLSRLSQDRARKAESIKTLTHEIEVLEKQLHEKKLTLQGDINAKVGIEVKIENLFPVKK
jgi:hypothetical protein